MRADVKRPLRLILGLALVAALFLAARSGHRYVLGGAVAALGITCVVWSLRLSAERVREEARTTVGPGWWIGWAASKLPGRGAKVVFLLMGIGITGLGVAALLGM